MIDTLQDFFNETSIIDFLYLVVTIISLIQCLIGSLLVNNEIFDEISTIISGINFYDPMHQKIFDAVDTLIYKGMLANPITLKNYFEDEKDDLNIPEYLVKITKFSTSVRQVYIK